MTTTLIKGGTIVSMDREIGDLPKGDVLVQGGRIAAVSPAIEPSDDMQVIDADGMIVMPGMINAHIHTWQTGLRGLAADWTIKQYMRAMHAGLATHFTPEDIHIANLVGSLNQINNGTTTLVDWCHNNPTPDHTDAAVDGLEQSGIRALFLHGSPKPDPKPGQKHFSEVPMPRDEVERLRNGRLSSNDSLVTLGLAVLGPGMSIFEVCQHDFELARELDLVASMHVSGGMKVPDGFERLDQMRLLGPRINLVHANIMSDETLTRVTGTGATVTVTAEVEMQMGFGYPLTGRLRALGAPVTIGSDIESSMTGDMFAVMRATLQGQRFVDNLAEIENSGTGPEEITIPCREALRWATIDNARMARMDHRIGSLTPGKQADIIALRATDLNLAPVSQPVPTIVLQAGPQNVDTVMIAGKLRKRGGILLSPDLPSRMDELAKSSRRILDDAGYGA